MMASNVGKPGCPHPIVMLPRLVFHLGATTSGYLPLEVFQLSDQILTLRFIPATIHRVNVPVHQERDAPHVREPAFLLALLFVDLLVVVSGHAMLEVETHQLQLELAVVAGSLALLDTELHAPRVPAIRAVPCRNCRGETDRLRWIDPVRREFGHLNIRVVADS